MHKLCKCSENKYFELKVKLEQLYPDLEILHTPRSKCGKNYNGHDKSRFYWKFNIPTIEIYVESDDLFNNPCAKIATLAHEFGHYQYQLYIPRDKDIIVFEEIVAWILGFKLLINNDIDIYHMFSFAKDSILSHAKYESRTI